MKAVLFAATPALLALLFVTVPTRTAPSLPAERVDIPSAHVAARVNVCIPHHSFQTYCETATDIVRGRVVDRRIATEGTSMPSTRIDFLVEDSIHGRLEGIQELSLPGANEGELRVQCPQAPDAAVGAELVLFLFQSPEGSVTGILGLDQGTYRVQSGAGGIFRVHGLHASGEPVEAFLDRVRAQVASPMDRPKQEEAR